MLVDQDDGNVFALGGEVVERLLNSRVLGLVIDHQEILLGIRRLGDMLQKTSALGIETWCKLSPQCPQGVSRSLNPRKRCSRQFYGEDLTQLRLG